MILKRLHNFGYFLIGLCVLFLYLSCCEANEGDHDKERLFLYVRSGNKRVADRSYLVAQQFGNDRNHNKVRIRSNGTASPRHIKKHGSPTGAAAHKEKEVGSSLNDQSNSSTVVATDEIVAAIIPLSSVTQEDTSSPSLPLPETTGNVAPQSNISNSSDGDAKGSPSSLPNQLASSPKNSTSNSENQAPLIVASSTPTENATLEELEEAAVSSPTSAAAASMKGVSKPSIPEFQLLSECGCKRSFYYNSDDLTGSKLNSSCSDEGTQYVPDQKVVSFSLPRSTSPGDYNRTSSYKQSIMDNLHRMRQFYPGYSMRLYTDLPLDSTFCRFLCLNADLFWCDIRNSVGGDQSKMLYSTWKFLPLGDPSVKLFLSRDISSLINEREAAAVEDWLGLNKTFHLMRDKRRVHNIAILGGLWGARNDLLGDDGEKLRSQTIPMSKSPRNKGYRTKNFDQDILSRVIFYPRKKEIVAYDSYHCKQWKKFTMVRPFPVKRNETVLVEDVGRRGSASNAVALIKKKYKLTKCPIECRPSYGKDWEYC